MRFSSLHTNPQSAYYVNVHIDDISTGGSMTHSALASFIGVFRYTFITCRARIPWPLYSIRGNTSTNSYTHTPTHQLFLLNLVEVKLRELEVRSGGSTQNNNGKGEKMAEEKKVEKKKTERTHTVAAHNQHNYYQQNKKWQRQTKSSFVCTV